jgi:hypothetical protein
MGKMLRFVRRIVPGTTNGSESVPAVAPDNGAPWWNLPMPAIVASSNRIYCCRQSIPDGHTVADFDMLSSFFYASRRL